MLNSTPATPSTPKPDRRAPKRALSISSLTRKPLDVTAAKDEAKARREKRLELISQLETLAGAAEASRILEKPESVASERFSVEEVLELTLERLERLSMEKQGASL